jgi:hypothetical protein
MLVADQTGANIERVQEIEKVCDLIHVELKAGKYTLHIISVLLITWSTFQSLETHFTVGALFLGDALFFHCNVLHTSSDNTSKNQRRALVIAYNRASNDPGPHEKHPGYTPLDIVSLDSESPYARVHFLM